MITGQTRNSYCWPRRFADLVPSNRLLWFGSSFTGLAVILSATMTAAYMPLFVPDAYIAAQADLIVVGRIKTGSVEYVPHDENVGASATDHGFIPRARLVITRVAYGKLEEREIELWFRRGTLPLVNGQFSYGKPGKARRIDMRRKNTRFPADSVQIGTLNNSFYSRSDIQNLCEDHLWFLKQHKDLPGLKPNEQAWCIDSFYYVAKADTEDYFVAYRAADPRKALLAQLAKYPDRADTIRTYVDYLDATNAGEIADPEKRVAAVLPFLFRDKLLDSDGRAFWSSNSASTMARAYLIDAGEPAGRALVKKLAEATDADARCRIVEILGEMKYRPAAAALDELLEQENKTWATVKHGEFDPSDESPKNRQRVEDFRETRVLAEALRKLASPKSRPVLVATLKIWNELNFGVITGPCEQTIQQIDEDARRR